jgi:cytochrome d ubiquinol oxidase subunit II
MDITVVWAAIIALGVFMYVVLDGFDLGVGIVFPFFPDSSDRDRMMNTLAPIWDGNETWLVLGGAALFAVFPVVYAITLSALYLPVVLMVVCLIFRGVSFEIRGKARKTKNLWSLAFMFGSAGATFMQGVILASYLHGIPVMNREFSGDEFFWITPFSLLTGLGLMVTYGLLGACWLVMKVDGDLQRRLYRLLTPLMIVLLVFIAAVSVWTPLSDVAIARRWFESGLLHSLLPIPFLVAITSALMVFVVRKRHDCMPFLLAIVLIALGYIGLLISIWPYAIPGSLSLSDAAAPRSSQMFTLVGAVIIIPIILVYTTAGYWVFRGKVGHDSAYH